MHGPFSLPPLEAALISEAIAWSALAVLAPALAPPAARRFKARWPRAYPFLAPLAPWLHGVAIAYLALFLGSIPERDFGLRGFPAVSWAYTLPICALALAAARWAGHYLAPFFEGADPWLRWLDEPRFALYRATGILWLGSAPLGIAAGLALAVAEWAIRAFARQGPRRTPPELPLRALLSAALFLFTRNFWATAGMQLILLLLLGRAQTAARPSTSRPEAGSAS